jgi:hypothetical protein
LQINQQQNQGNYRLIYAMIRDKEAFSELATLTLDALSKSRPKKKSVESEIPVNAEPIVDDAQPLPEKPEIQDGEVSLTCLVEHWPNCSLPDEDNRADSGGSCMYQIAVLTMLC